MSEPTHGNGAYDKAAINALAAAMRFVGTDGESPTPGDIPWCGCLAPDALATDAAAILLYLYENGWELGSNAR